ncbi:MAG: hypothetical protein BPHS0_56 [Phage 5P_3]|nr:MAG: hypothetical protein BPHS0_56 [Phage 5P_3]
MWLSRLYLNAALWPIERNSYTLHQIVERGVGHTDDERALWRIEGGEIIVQTRYLPDWTEIEREGLATSDYRPYGPIINAGDSFLFRLCANPTVTLSHKGNNGRGKRVGLVKEAEQRAWLERKAALAEQVTELVYEIEEAKRREHQAHPPARARVGATDTTRVALAVVADVWTQIGAHETRHSTDEAR